MAKESDFGGLPQDLLTTFYAEWSSTAKPSGLTDTQWIAKLVDKVTVLDALVREEHAAANAGDVVDIIAVVMKSIDVRDRAKDAIGGASIVPLVTELGKLEKLWGK